MARGKRRSREELDDLSRSFLDLRNAAGLDQIRAAKAAGVTQSLISRVETGRKTPDEATVRKLAQAYKATPDERRRLIELTILMKPAVVDSRLVMQRGQNLHFQQRYAKIEAATSLHRAFHPCVVLGSMQTPAYAHAIFTAPRPGRPANTDSADDLAATRDARWQQLATDTDRRSVFVQTQGALDWHIGSPTVMAAQLDRLIEASLLPPVRLGIIPARAHTRVVPSGGFDIYDSRAVSIGTRTAVALTDDPKDIADYEALFGELERVAVFGDEARALIGRTAEDYRRMA